MRSWIACGIVLACTAASAGALACPVGQDVRPIRPVQNVSFQASEMLERAARLESAASSREAQARAFDQEADALSSRARALRNQATLVNVADRGSILEIADELSSRAAVSRARAAEDRAQAAELRIEAQSLRQRAIALVRGPGGGWRGKPVRSPTAPLPFDRTVTL
ncbi:MAG TPA: hypothetical protein VM925_32865 [Labilithrix sp.]|nr:hypothetical protein [Labilithrix sp.]